MSDEEKRNALVAAHQAERGATDAMMRDIVAGKVPAAIAVMMDEGVFNRVNAVAERLAKANGIVPQHLIGNVNACFAVVMRSLSWRLDPFAVAQSTFAISGKIGYEGKLCQAILEQSGAIVGQIKYAYFGKAVLKSKETPGLLIDVRTNDPALQDALESGRWTEVRRTRWEDLVGKFEIRTSQKNDEKKYTVPTWPKAAEDGLGVTVLAQVREEAEKRSFDFELVQAYPRNSTIWATDPKTQLGYAAIRRFASVAAPSLVMGIPFDRDEMEGGMKNITPQDEEQPREDQRPVRSQFSGATTIEVEQEPDEKKPEPEPEPDMPADPVTEATEAEERWELYDETGEPVENFAKDKDGLVAFVNAIEIRFKATKDAKVLKTLFDNVPMDLLPVDAQDHLKKAFSTRLTKINKDAPPPADKASDQGGLSV